jgi:acyl-CoA synthetase (NDP forming)
MVEKYDKPVAYYISTAAQEVSYLKQNYNFPIFTQVVETIRALEMSHQHYCQSERLHSMELAPAFKVNKPAVRELIDHALAESRDLLLSEALQVLEHYGILTARSLVALNVEEAQKAAHEIGFPVAIKIIAEQISHKSDVGGVQLNLRTPEALTIAFEDMMERIRKAYPDVKLDGVRVQPMVTGGRELILGGRQDPHFGPIILVGLGGIFVEIFEEVVVRVVPITQSEVMRMIENLRGYQILQGARGHMRSDIESVAETLLRLSQLLIDFPEIKEMDINPLRVFHEEEGCRALDARMIVA